MSLLAALVRVGAGLAVATLAGAAVSASFTRELTRRERAAWSLATGLLVQAVCLVILLAAGIRPRALALFAAEVVLAGAACWMTRGTPRRVDGHPAAKIGTEGRLAVGLLTIAFGAWVIFLIGALAEPMGTTDFVAFWGYKAKVIFLTSEIPQRLFQDPALDFAHKEYPLLVPFSLAALAGWNGEWNDQALALLFPVCEAVTLLAILGFLSRRVSLVAGATAAALASICFFLYRPANVGTADVPFALALVLLATAALDFLSRDEAASAWRLAVASLFCVSLKQEGAVFVALVAITIFLRLRSADPRAGRRAAAVLVATAAAHAMLLYLLRGHQASRDFDFTLLEPGRWAELPSLLSLVLGRLARIGSSEALVPILSIVVVFLVTRRGIGEPLLPVFFAQILLYAAAFTISSFDPLYAIESAFRRITMSLFPAFTLVLCSRQIR